MQLPTNKAKFISIGFGWVRDLGPGTLQCLSHLYFGRSSSAMKHPYSNLDQQTLCLTTRVKSQMCQSFREKFRKSKRI